MLLLLFVFDIYYIVIFYLFISTFIYYLNVEKKQLDCDQEKSTTKNT